MRPWPTLDTLARPSTSCTSSCRRETCTWHCGIARQSSLPSGMMASCHRLTTHPGAPCAPPPLGCVRGAAASTSTPRGAAGGSGARLTEGRGWSGGVGRGGGEQQTPGRRGDKGRGSQRAGGARGAPGGTGDRRGEFRAGDFSSWS
eukprot:scaffold84278_cov35-Tisochrysis_lutea.AAC.6